MNSSCANSGCRSTAIKKRVLDTHLSVWIAKETDVLLVG